MKVVVAVVLLVSVELPVEPVVLEALVVVVVKVLPLALISPMLLATKEPSVMEVLVVLELVAVLVEVDAVVAKV